MLGFDLLREMSGGDEFRPAQSRDAIGTARTDRAEAT